jgi:hypothetical protein
LGWSLVPLSTLAALEAARWLRSIAPLIEIHYQKLAEPSNFSAALPDSDEETFESEPQPIYVSSGVWETLGMSLLTFILLAFAWLNFTGAALVTFDAAGTQLRWLVTAGALVLLALSVLLVAFGWSKQVAAQGFFWGMLPALAIYSLAMASFAANLRPNATVEMWPSGPQTREIGVIATQARELSLTARGADLALRVALVDIDSPALRWLLREWQVSSSKALSLESNPDLIVMPSQASMPELEAGYRGATLAFRSYPGWEGSLPDEWLRWVVNHDLPQGYETVLFWARTDLFPDSQNLVP